MPVTELPKKTEEKVARKHSPRVLLGGVLLSRLRTSVRRCAVTGVHQAFV